MTTSNRTKSETIQAIQEQIDEVQLLTQSENNTDEGNSKSGEFQQVEFFRKLFRMHQLLVSFC